MLSGQRVCRVRYLVATVLVKWRFLTTHLGLKIELHRPATSRRTCIGLLQRALALLSVTTNGCQAVTKWGNFTRRTYSPFGTLDMLKRPSSFVTTRCKTTE